MGQRGIPEMLIVIVVVLVMGFSVCSLWISANVMIRMVMISMAMIGLEMSGDCSGWIFCLLIAV